MNRQEIGIIIQARMGSSRLPGKILMTMGRKVLLEHILDRLTKLRHAAMIVIATSDTSADDIVESFCQAHAVACFRGSEDNVLDRYYQCAVHYGFRHIVRLTGDNPFPDMEELDNLIDLHLSARTDYANSFASLPLGVGAEIFTFAALERSWREGNAPHHLEHVNEYLLEHPEIFRTTSLKVSPDKNRPEVRLTVDTAEDYARACYIFARYATDCVSTVEAIQGAAEFALKATAP